MQFWVRYKKKDPSHMLTFHPIIDDLEQAVLLHSAGTPAGHSRCPINLAHRAYWSYKCLVQLPPFTNRLPENQWELQKKIGCVFLIFLFIIIIITIITKCSSSSSSNRFLYFLIFLSFSNSALLLFPLPAHSSASLPHFPSSLCSLNIVLSLHILTLHSCSPILLALIFLSSQIIGQHVQ
jgi:hypothetical protein